MIKVDKDLLSLGKLLHSKSRRRDIYWRKNAPYIVRKKLKNGYSKTKNQESLQRMRNGSWNQNI